MNSTELDKAIMLFTEMFTALDVKNTATYLGGCSDPVTLLKMYIKNRDENEDIVRYALNHGEAHQLSPKPYSDLVEVLNQFVILNPLAHTPVANKDGKNIGEETILQYFKTFQSMYNSLKENKTD